MPGKETLKLTNIPLNNSTTYSGADTQVFIYRDLSKIKEFEKRTNDTFSTRDSTVTTEEAVRRQRSEEAANSVFTGSQDGSVARGEADGDGAFRKGEPTNRVDHEYIERSRPVSSFTDGTGANDSYLSKLGLDSVMAEIGSLHSMNYSSFREKVAVRTLGRTHARHYTRGQRTIAGTMVFNVLQSHELLRFANSVQGDYVAMLDQMDPFNMVILFNNEYGSLSTMHLFNIDINTETQGMSVDNLLLNNTMNFYAQDILPMEETGNVFNNTKEMLDAAFSEQRFKSFINEFRSNQITGLKSLDGSLSGGSPSDTRVQKLLRRSRGLF